MANGVEPKIKLDDIDLQILQLLQQHGRMTNARLAQEVGLSAPPMLERVKKLERLGIITGYRAILDAKRLGRDFFVFVAINVDVAQLSNVERIEKQLSDMKEVLECHHIAGDIDFLVKVNVEDQEAYKGFVTENLAKIGGISRLHSWVVLSTIKDSTELHIQREPKQT
jgi:Lrp/AsnC family leucine-responsive transcriptional regulator